MRLLLYFPDVLEAKGAGKGMMMLQGVSSGVMLVYQESIWDCNNREGVA